MAQAWDRPSSILVVEDEVLFRLSVAENLRESGFVVIEASRAEEAMTLLETRSRPVDLLLTDLGMPGAMDGLGLARWVRAKFPEIPIIILSGALPGLVLPGDGDAVFSKPHSPAALLTRIHELLRHRSGRGTVAQSNGG
jgi:DNA-binding response OmpR family regulator